MHFETMSETNYLAQHLGFRVQNGIESNDQYKLALADEAQSQGRIVEAGELRTVARVMAGLSLKEIAELDPLSALKLMNPEFEMDEFEHKIT